MIVSAMGVTQTDRQLRFGEPRVVDQRFIQSRR